MPLKHFACATALALLTALPLRAELLVDPDFGFQLEIPDDWRGERVVEGEDRVLKFESSDGLSYGEARVFALDNTVTAQQLRMAFGQGAMADAQFAGAQADVVAGLTGEVAAWRVTQDGFSTIVGGFFAVQDGLAYILLTIVDEPSFTTYSPVFDQIFNTFQYGAPGTGSAGLSGGEASGSQLPQIDRTGTELLQGLVAQPHPELGFVVVHKGDWEAMQPAPYSLRLAPMALERNVQPSVMIEALSGAAYPSLQAFAADMRGQLAGEDGIYFSEEGPYGLETLTLDGVPLQGWTLSARYYDHGTPFAHRFFLFYRPEPSVYYGVYLAGPEEQMAVYEQEMMNIVQTLQMIPFGG